MRWLLGLLGLGLLCLGCGGSDGASVQGNGGTSGGVGAGGFGGSGQPNTGNFFIEQIVDSRVNKVDLLLMIDNSPSMGDKQQLLKSSLPLLLKLLISPICLDGDGKPTGASASSD